MALFSHEATQKMLALYWTYTFVSANQTMACHDADYHNIHSHHQKTSNLIE